MGILVKTFLNNLINKSSDPLLSLLNDIDLKKEKIKTIQDLLDYLLEKTKSGEISEQDILKSLMRIMLSTNIDEEQVRTLITKQKIITRKGPGSLYWIIPLVVAGLISIFIVGRKRRKKKEVN